MSVLSTMALMLCYLSVAVTVISLFLPQKRTRKIFSFVIGLFVIASLILCVRGISIGVSDDFPQTGEIPQPSYDEDAYNDMVMRATVENLVSAMDEILQSEGISARDIRISLKISDEGRIYVDDIVIYISEDDLLRKQEIESIVYRNLSKEPAVYVEKEEVE